MNNKYILFACAVLAAQSIPMYAPLEFEERAPIEPVKPVESSYQTAAARAKKAATTESSYTSKPTVRTSRGSTASTIEYGVTPGRSSRGVALSEDGSPLESSLSVKSTRMPYSPSAEGAFSDAAAAADALDFKTPTPTQRFSGNRISPDYTPVESYAIDSTFETSAPEEVPASEEPAISTPARRKGMTITSSDRSPETQSLIKLQNELRAARTASNAALEALIDHQREYGSNEEVNRDYSNPDYYKITGQRAQLQTALTKASAKVKDLTKQASDASKAVQLKRGPQTRLAEGSSAFDDAAAAADEVGFQAPAQRRPGQGISPKPLSPLEKAQKEYYAASDALAAHIKEYGYKIVNESGRNDYSREGSALRAQRDKLQAAATKASAKVKDLQAKLPQRAPQTSLSRGLSAFDAAALDS